MAPPPKVPPVLPDSTVPDASAPGSPARRRFVRALAAGGIALPALPALGAPGPSSRQPVGPAADAPSREASRDAAEGAAGRARHLVLVELQGGNDGLNTLVPYADPVYRTLRPTLAHPRDAVLPLDERVGLHPALAPLMPLWGRGELAVVEGVGYPEPNRSHFRSIEIWETASGADEVREDGWLAPLARTLLGGTPGTIGAVALADDEGPLAGATAESVVLEDVERFVRQATRLEARELAATNPTLAHVLEVERTVRRAALEFSRRLEASLADRAAPADGPPLVRRLDAIARLIAEDAGPRLWKVGLGSFDTHVNQLGRHARLMGELAAGIAHFEAALVAAGRWGDVALATYSEFGRRAAENGSGGTDHGTAAPHLVAGGAVRGGLHGAPAGLDRLEGGDLAFTTDFRALYASLAGGWLGQRPGGMPWAGFGRLPLFG